MFSRGTNLTELLSQHTTIAAEELSRREPDDIVRCLACGHRCHIGCLAATACVTSASTITAGYAFPYGYVSSLASDPIEKKPFFHAYPGSEALSFGMLGCNFHCPFCQNWVTSQTLRDSRATVEPQLIDPEQIVRIALEHNCKVLSSTYNEPLITSEWAVEIFKLGQPHGLIGSYVSNGHATPEVLEYLRPHVDLFNIDLKAFRDTTYRKLGGILENVLETIRLAKQMDYWIEIITLVVPDLNDSNEELTEIADFVAGVSPEIPWHVTAFHPTYKMTEPPRTPVETLQRAADIGRRAGLKFVYAGNLPSRFDEGENTRCPSCGACLIERSGFTVRRNNMQGAACPACHERIPGVWEQGAG